MLLKIIRKIVYLLVVLLAIICALAQFAALTAPVIRPDELDIPTLLSMIEPVLFVLNLLFCAILGVFLKKWALLSLLAIICSAGHMKSYYPIQFSREYNIEKKIKKPLRLMSYNVRGFGGSKEKLDSALMTAEEFDPDIISFIEFAPVQDSVGTSMIQSRLPKLKYHFSNRGINGNLNVENGIVVFSKYPLKNATKYENNAEGTAVIADVIRDYGDTTRIFAIHLHTTAYNYISQEKSIESYMTDSLEQPLEPEIKSRTIKLITTISSNSETRSYQADTIRQKVDASPYKSIIMGDFNDTPYSYSVRTIMGDTHLDPFSEKAKNIYGYTYNALHKLFRIDYIMPEKKHFEVIDYNSPDLTISDHNPVMVTLSEK